MNGTMDTEALLQQVMAFFAERADDAQALTPNSELCETVLLDSLMVLETVVFLEQSFGLQLERADLDALHTPQAIVELILRKR